MCELTKIFQCADHQRLNGALGFNLDLQSLGLKVSIQSFECYSDPLFDLRYTRSCVRGFWTFWVNPGTLIRILRDLVAI